MFVLMFYYFSTVSCFCFIRNTCAPNARHAPPSTASHPSSPKTCAPNARHAPPSTASHRCAPHRTASLIFEELKMVKLMINFHFI